MKKLIGKTCHFRPLYHQTYVSGLVIDAVTMRPVNGAEVVFFVLDNGQRVPSAEAFFVESDLEAANL